MNDAFKPNVFIIIDTAHVSGPAKGIFQFLEQASHNNFDYALCSFEYKRNGCYKRGFIEESLRRKINLKLIHERFRFDPAPLFQCCCHLKSANYNLIQSHNYKSHLFAFIISRLLKIPWIAFAHGWTTEDLKVKYYHFLDRLLLPRAEMVVCVSPQLHKTVSAWRGENMETRLIFNAVQIPPEIEREHKEISRHKLLNNPQGLVLGCFGRLSSEKGQVQLIAAVAKVNVVFPDTLLLLVGEGPDREALELQVEQLGLKTKVIFFGHQTDMRQFYELIDILVLPSLSEGLPNVVLEAMALAIPVLATDVGAIREIIKHQETGWIVDHSDPIELANAILGILSQRQNLLTVGKAARKSLYPKFCPKQRALNIFKAYVSTLEKQARC